MKKYENMKNIMVELDILQQEYLGKIKYIIDSRINDLKDERINRLTKIINKQDKLIKALTRGEAPDIKHGLITVKRFVEESEKKRMFFHSKRPAIVLASNLHPDDYIDNISKDQFINFKRGGVKVYGEFSYLRELILKEIKDKTSIE